MKSQPRFFSQPFRKTYRRRTLPRRDYLRRAKKERAKRRRRAHGRAALLQSGGSGERLDSAPRQHLHWRYQLLTRYDAVARRRYAAYQAAMSRRDTGEVG